MFLYHQNTVLNLGLVLNGRVEIFNHEVIPPFNKDPESIDKKETYDSLSQELVKVQIVSTRFWIAF